MASTTALARSTARSWLGWTAGVLIVGSQVAFDPAGWAVFGPIKWMIVLAATFVVAAALLRRGGRVHRGSAIAWLVFLGWGVVVSLTAVDPLYTWIGTPDRHLGLLAWCVFFLLFVAGQSLTEGGPVRVVVRAVVVALVGVGLYSVLELLGTAPVDLSSTSSRLGGPFGSAAYLGAACALLLPIAVGGFVDGLGSRAWRAASAGAVAVGLVALVGSETRAAWLGMVVAAVFVVPALRPWLRRLRWIPLVAGVVLLVLLVVSPAGARVRSLVDGDDPAARGRWDEWRVATAIIVDRPLLGAGFEGQRVVFPGYVDADYERAYGRRVTPDRAHSGALDLGVTTGLPGMLLYLAAIGWLLWRAFRAVRGRDPLLVGTAAGVAAYLVQQQLLFPLADVDPVFWLLAGMLVAGTSTGDRWVEVPQSSLGVVVAAVLAVLTLGAGLLDVGADRLADRALTESAAGQTEVALATADRASDLRPDSIRYRVVAGAVAAAEGTTSGLEAAVARIDSAIELSPRDPILRIRRAEYLLDLARTSDRPEDLDRAQESWIDVAGGDPNNAEVQLQLGIVLAMAHDAAGAEQAWLAAEFLAPDSAAPAANLAALYAAAGLPDEARAALERARRIDPDLPELAEVEKLVAQVEAGG